MSEESKKTVGTIKKFLLAIGDIALFAIANALLCFFVYRGHIFGVPYSAVLFNYAHFLLLSAAVVCIHSVTGLYRRVWTYAGMDEIVVAAFAAIIDSAVLFVTDKVFELLGYSVLPFYYYALNILFMIAGICTPRIGYRIIRTKVPMLVKRNDKNLKRVMIVGAGYMGNAIITNIASNQNATHKVVVAIDDNPAKKNKRINGIKIVGNCNEIPYIANKYNIDEIIICIPSASKPRQMEIFQTAVGTGRKVKTTPDMSEILADGISTKKLRDVDITDLLSRDEVSLDVKVCKYLIDTTILVTGGGGSIGSELCMQCARYNPKTIVIFDIYENCAFELYQELKRKYGDKINIYIRIGSVRDEQRLDEVFSEFVSML